MLSNYLRRPSTKRDGNGFTAQEIDAVWSKGTVIPNFNSNLWRYDTCGTLMKKTEYGNRNSLHGWEVDHKMPVAKGGGDELGNLQPLQWENNAHKSDNYPQWYCKLRA